MVTSCNVHIGITYHDKLFQVEEKIAKFSVEETKSIRQ